LLLRNEIVGVALDDASLVVVPSTFGYSTAEDSKDGLSQKERDTIDTMGKFESMETGYRNIQGTKPQTLGVGLNDSILPRDYAPGLPKHFVPGWIAMAMLNRSSIEMSY
jgi:hypothetical protein